MALGPPIEGIRFQNFFETLNPNLPRDLKPDISPSPNHDHKSTDPPYDSNNGLATSQESGPKRIRSSADSADGIK